MNGAGDRVPAHELDVRGAGGGEIADVLGVLEAADAVSFTVRKASGELVTIPRDRVLAGKTVPAAPRRDRREPESGAGSHLRPFGMEGHLLVPEVRHDDRAG
jgi:hypothetical protein